MPAVQEHLTPNFYLHEVFSFSVAESSILGSDPIEKVKTHEQDSILPNFTLTSPRTKLEKPTKSYVDSLHENSRNRRDLSSVIIDQEYAFDNTKLTNLDSFTVNRDPTADIELAHKKQVDESVGSGIILGFNETTQNYLKVSVGNDVYNLTKYDKIQFTDTTLIKFPNSGGYLLQQLNIKRNDKNNFGEKQTFFKSTKTSRPTGFSEKTSSPPMGESFMYTETKQKI